MLAERIDLKNVVILLSALLLIAAPSHAQTLQASVSQVTIGEVENCNDSQAIGLTTTGGAITLSATLSYASGDNHGNWLFLKNSASNATTTNGSLTVSIPSGGSATLIVGLNSQIGVNDTATVTLTTVSPAGQTLTIPVTDQYTLSCNGITLSNGPLSVIPATLSLTAPQGSFATQDVIVSNVSATSITINPVVNPLFPWLSISLGMVTLAPNQQIGIAVTASAGGLTPGTYSGGFGIQSSAGGTIFVPVSFTVTSNGSGTGVSTGVKASTNNLSFTFTPGGSQVIPQSVSFTNLYGSGTENLSVAVVQYNGPANWLSTGSIANATTPLTLQVSVNPTGFVPGVTYQGTITVTPYLGAPVEVYVSVAVAQAPVVTATPTSLTFTATQGGAITAAQQVLVSAGGAEVSWATTALDSWLHVNPPTGSSPNGGYTFVTPANGGAYMSVWADPTGLPAGTYTGTVTVYGSGPAVGNTNIAVTLVVNGPNIQSVNSAASFLGGAVAPGEMVTLFSAKGGGFGPANGVSLTQDMIVDSKLPTTMGGVQVFFNGVAGPLIYASAGQINTIVPYEIAGSDHVDVTVKYNGLTTAPFRLQTAIMLPGMFTSTATGIGQGAIGQYDSNGNYAGLNSTSNPVSRGNVITLYVTGEGKTKSPVTGLITNVQSSAPYTPQPMMPPTVLIDGQPASVLFYGEVPGVVAGMMQINVIVPNGIRTGNNVPVSIAMGSSYSQAGVTIAAR